MPEDDWTSLTVGERVGARIKALAGSRGLTISDYLERLKAKDVPEHTSKVHPGGHWQSIRLKS
jgi:hypothetical protein